jgi:hypothetical protein
MDFWVFTRNFQNPMWIQLQQNFEKARGIQFFSPLYKNGENNLNFPSFFQKVLQIYSHENWQIKKIPHLPNNHWVEIEMIQSRFLFIRISIWIVIGNWKKYNFWWFLLLNIFIGFFEWFCLLGKGGRCWDDGIICTRDFQNSVHKLYL